MISTQKGLRMAENHDITAAEAERLRAEEYSYAFLPDPSYEFEPGDTDISVGLVKEPKIVSVSEDKRFYLISDGKNRLWFPWTAVRKKPGKSHGLIKNAEVKVFFSTLSLGNVLHNILSSGVDFSPEYQRDFVWSDHDREALLASVFENIDIGKFVFVEAERYEKGKPCEEILDGKQRLTTLLDFYLDRFPYHGLYFSDLSMKERKWFNDRQVSVGHVRLADRKQVMQIFVILNTCGHVMEQKNIDRIKALIGEK